MIGLLYQFPTWMQRLYRGVTWRHRDTGAAYLTFDDGPIPDITPAILDILAKYGVKATFFVVGDNIQKYPHIYARMLSEGHRVGNHTMHHIKGTKFNLDDYMRDVDECRQIIDEHTSPTLMREGQGGKPLFRPPYGRMKYSQKRATLNRGYEIILWDVLTHDYNPRYTPEKMLRVVKRYTRSGSIINFHDSVKSGARTIEVLPQVIEWLQAEGYKIEVL
ncbi:MAG: polysaccharide deacetylase family protein [Paludibacteraceae bacterium]|nr:polysaccharide deacetylase family protein [Paludibacteraceae bacterium]